MKFFQVVLHIVTQSLLLHLIAATTSQYMPPPSPYPYPYNHGPQQMPMMQMPNGQQMMQMPPGPQMMQMPGGPQMMQMPSGPQMMQMPNGAPMMPMPNGPHMMQMPNALPMMPHMPRMPGMPPPMHLPMSLPMNGGRMPMMVMPHYSKKADKPRRKSRKPKRKRINMASSSSEGSCSQSEEYRSKNALRSGKKRGGVLTPVVSYVTKDGYVVYQKKIKKDKAKDWLELSKGGSGEYKDKKRDH